MGRRTHGPHLLVAIDANDHAKVHEILAVQIRNKNKIRETCTADIKRLASDNVDCPLMLAAAIPDATIIRYLVLKQGNDVNFVHRKGTGKRIKLHTPLIIAVKVGLYHTVEVLLELNANTNLQDHKGRTALHHAVCKANYRMAKMLLTKGAQPNLTDKSDNSPLHVATKFGHLELVKLLMQYGGDLYKRGQYGAIPIHIAAKDGHISLIEWLATHGSNINVKIPCYAEMREKTPLNVACEEGHVEAVLTLIQKCKADVNMADSEGETPLHCTVLHEYDPFGMKSKDDYADTALLLLKFGADCNKKNDRGETALHHASRNEFQKVAELLIRAGADPLVEDFDRNKAIDLVSDDDAVTTNLLKRAVTDREKLMSELLEIRARGFSTSTQSLNQLMLSPNMSFNSPMSQSMMQIPTMSQGMISRTNSSPGLFLQDGSMIYSQDGYLQPFSSRPRLGSIGSQASFGVQSFAGMPLHRQDSIGSFHSAMTAPVNTYCSIDSDGVVSESAAIGIVAPRLIRRKRGTEKRNSQNAPRDSSDSSQYEDIPVKPKHSTPRQRSASVDVINSDHHRKAKKPKAPFLIQPLGKQAGRKQKGQTGKMRSSQSSLNSQASTLSKSSYMSGSTITPYTSQSTLRADDDTSEGNTSSRSTPEGSHASTTFTDGTNGVGEDVTDGDVYENMPCDESQTIYDNIPDEKPSPGKPQPPPRAPRRPLPPLPPKQQDDKPLPSVPSSPPVAQESVTTPSTKAADRSSQEITIKISPHQSITIKTSPNGQAQAIQVNSLLPEDQPQANSPAPGINNTMDSDDTFFDDESFETISDMLEPRGNRHKPPPPPKPSHLHHKKKPSPEQLNKVLNDPKLQDWLSEQAVLLKERKPQGPGPIAQSTPPLSRRELENKLRYAFGKPPLSDSETEDGSDPRKVAPIPQKQILLQNQHIDSTDDEEIKQLTSKVSPGAKGEGDFVEYTDMNDLNKPGKSLAKPIPPARKTDTPKSKQGAPVTPKHEDKQWEKVHLETNSNDTSQASLYWDHTEDTLTHKRPPVKQQQNNASGPEVVYMEMNGTLKAPVKDLNKQQHKPKLNQEAFNQQLQHKLQQHEMQNSHQDTNNIKAQQQNATESDDFDDDSFDSFESDSDDEGIPNSCHQVARHFKLPPQSQGMANLVLATPTGDIVPNARHSSTNAHSVMLPGAGEMNKRFDKPPSPSKKGTQKAKADIVVVRDGALVNGMPLNQPSPVLVRRSNSIQEERNAQLVTSIKQSQQVMDSHNANGAPYQGVSRSPSHTSLGNTSRQNSVEPACGNRNDMDGSPPQQQQRKVTIGPEKIKLISDEEKLPADHDHRQITFDTKGKMRLTIIGGNSDGVFIHRIDPGSDAEQQGLMEGDQILQIDGVSTIGKTKEEVTLQLMSLQEIVSMVVRHKTDRYNSIRLNGGMGDAFFVKACFTHDPKQKGEMKIHDGDIFSVRDTLPNGRMGSWQALKVNARPNEAQHGLIPNESRAEQVALASRKALERGRGIEKENRGSFIRRSLRRSKSAERLQKENEAFTKSQVPQLEDVKTYERVEQRAPGFLRPVIVIGLFCDSVRDRLLQDLPGMFEKPPPEVEIPTTAEAGDSNKVPVDARHIQDIIRTNKHPLMIMSPRAIQYLATTKLYPIIIYLTPGSKDVVKKLRVSLAPGFAKRSSYMFEESQLFAKTYAHLFTATVTYTTDDAWYALLKDTIKRIQNQPLWQPASKQVIVNGDNEEQPHGSSPEGHYSAVDQGNKLPRLSSSTRIPDPIRNALHRHAQGGSTSNLDTPDIGAQRPRQMALTYDGYFLSDTQQSEMERAPSSKSLHNGSVRGHMSEMNAYSSGAAKSMDDIQADIRPRSILKNKSPSAYALPIENNSAILDKESPPKKYQQIGLMPVHQLEENNNGIPQSSSVQMSPHQLTQQHVMQQQIMLQQQQQLQAAKHQQTATQQMLIQQMFQQQFVQQQQQQQQQQQHQQMMAQQGAALQGNQPMTRTRGLTHEVRSLVSIANRKDWNPMLSEMFIKSGLNQIEIEDILQQLALKPIKEQQRCVQDMVDLWLKRNKLLTSSRSIARGHMAEPSFVHHKPNHKRKYKRQSRSLDDLDSIETDL